jgi:hypothetical protein
MCNAPHAAMAEDRDWSRQLKGAQPGRTASGQKNAEPRGALRHSSFQSRTAASPQWQSLDSMLATNEPNFGRPASDTRR